MANDNSPQQSMALAAVTPFIKAARTTFDGLQMEKVISQVDTISPDPAIKGELAAVMPVNGSIEGCVILSMGSDTSTSIARQMLGEGKIDDEITDSVVLELVNIILGRAQVQYESDDRNFEFTTPSLIKGTGINSPIDLAECYYLQAADFELVTGGHFYLQFYFYKPAE